MNTVPDMISTKDLSYISDIFNWNFTACKKANSFSNEATMEDIKNKLKEVSDTHLNICRKLIDMLIENNPYETKVCNQKTEVEQTKNLNDKDFLTDLLESEKNMSDNLSIALNEASNNTLYENLYTIFNDVRQKQRELYNLMFEKGWYCLEKAENNKITQKKTQLENELKEISE